MTNHSLIKDRPGWKIESVVIPSTGEHYNRYFYRRTKAKRIELTSKLAQQLGGYALIERDLRMVLSWLLELKDLTHGVPLTDGGWWESTTSEKLHPIVQSLFFSSISFYGKCFSECKGRKIKLDTQWVPEEFKATHKLLLQMRNNFTAHSGTAQFESVNVALVLARKGPKLKDEPLLIRELVQMEAMHSLDDDQTPAIKLLEIIHGKVKKKMGQLNDKIFKEEINPKGMEYWLSLKT